MDKETGMKSDAPLSVNVRFPQRVLNFGFYSAIVLAGLCLLATIVYLMYFLFSTSQAVEAILQQTGVGLNAFLLKEVAIKSRLYMASLCLVSCGIMVGMAFGFLGFGLFLIGIRDAMDAGAESPEFRVTLVKISPGLLLLLCATLLIGICATHDIPFSLSITAPIESESQSTDSGLMQRRDQLFSGISPPSGDIPLPP